MISSAVGDISLSRIIIAKSCQRTRRGGAALALRLFRGSCLGQRFANGLMRALGGIPNMRSVSVNTKFSGPVVHNLKFGHVTMSRGKVGRRKRR